MTDEPSVLWHYTAQAALVKILESKALYASDVLYMNDHMELRHAVDLLPSILESMPEFRKFAETSDGLANVLYALKHSLFESRPRHSSGTYAVSLSEEPDDLSQWRAYSGDVTGYALGFDRNLLEAIQPSPRWPMSLSRCRYDKEEQMALLRRPLEEFAQTDIGKRYCDRGHRGPAFDGNFRHHFMSAAPWLKNPAFKREGEWRLVSQRMLFREGETEFGVRDGRQFLVPYLKLPLEVFQQALCCVIVGPNAHPDNALAATKILLDHHRIAVADVSLSKVPYRRV